MFQHRDSSHAAEDSCLVTDNPFASHPQVRLNESVIWTQLEAEIEQTISRLNVSDTIHVVDIGGASLLGLSSLSKTQYFSHIRYTIVDSAPAFDQALLEKTGAEYLQMSTDKLTEALLGDVHLVLAVRALEYDRNYLETLKLLHRVSASPAYGIFVHNAEHSAALTDIRTYLGVIRFRLSCYSIVRNFIDGSIRFDEALDEVRLFAESLPNTHTVKEVDKLRRLLKRCQAVEKSSALELLAEREELYQNQVRQACAMYEERLNSRRFWAEHDDSDIRSLYRQGNVQLLQRVDAQVMPGGLQVHIDTVDLAATK